VLKKRSGKETGIWGSNGSNVSRSQGAAWGDADHDRMGLPSRWRVKRRETAMGGWVSKRAGGKEGCVPGES